MWTPQIGKWKGIEIVQCSDEEAQRRRFENAVLQSAMEKAMFGLPFNEAEAELLKKWNLV